MFLIAFKNSETPSLESIAAWYSKLAALPNAVSTAVVVVLEVFISVPTKEKGLTPTNQPVFLACPDSWATKHVVKVNNAKKNSKAVVVIFVVIFCMVVFFHNRNIFHNCYIF